MKFSASSFLFGIFASIALAPNHSALVSAKPVILSQVKNDIDASVVSALSPFHPKIDPNVKRLSIQGLDLSEPLSEAETAFLESTIQDVFNKIHEDMDIDLYAESVSVGTNAIVSNQTIVNNSTSSNLRGVRKLERNFQGRPGADFHPCQYQRGPKKGEWMDYCDIDFEVYLCHRCWMCIDDDFEIGENFLPQKPTPVPAPRPTLSDYDRLKMFMDDDYYDNLPPTYKPAPAPTKKPTSAPTKDEVKTSLEEERGPNEPNFYKPPPKVSPFDREVLKKLQQGPFHRFNKIKKLRFGY